MKKCLPILLALFISSGLAVSPAFAKKEFSKGDAASKQPLGPNTITLPSGLMYKDVKVGTGTEAKFGNVVWIDYTGWVMPDLKEFDSTKLKGRPLNLVLGGAQICRGLDEGILNMKMGGKRLLLIPPDLGFPKGSDSSSVIQAGAPIKYEISLVHVGPKLPKKPAAPPAGTAAPAGGKTAPAKPTGKPS